MTNISKVSLEDTLYLVQLMRETALAQGKQAQANRLSPVESEIRGLVSTAKQAQPAQAAAPASGILAQSDFKKLLDVTQSRSASSPTSVPSTTAALERNRMIQAMSSANMSEIDIARQFGISLDEVRLVTNVQNKGITPGGIK
jgi:hypothetical protein